MRKLDAGAAGAAGMDKPVVMRAAERTGSASPRMRCILIHGFNGEPVDMRELDVYLAGHGFATTNMLLPGHGSTMRSFAAARWEHWLEAVRMETRDAHARGERVILIGHSMGAALSLAMAALDPRVASVVALCPPLGLDDGVRARFVRMHHVLPYFPSFGEDVRDRWGARRRYERKAYRWVALATVRSLFGALPELRGMLPDVRCPTLVMAARRDHVVPVRDGIEAYRMLGAREKELLVLGRSYHVVTKDVERHIVFERVADFCQRQRANLASAAESPASEASDQAPAAELRD
jgi:carboxylesterase